MESKNMKASAEDKSFVLDKVLQNINLPPFLENETKLDLPNIMNTVLDEVDRQNGIERMSEYIHALPTLVTKVEKSLQKSEIYLKEAQIEHDEYIEKFGESASPTSTQIKEIMKEKLQEGKSCISKCSLKVELIMDDFRKNLGQLLILKSTKGEIRLTYIEALKQGNAFFHLNHSYQQLKQLKEEMNVLIKQLDETGKVPLNTISSALIPDSQLELTKNSLNEIMSKISKIGLEQESLLKTLQDQNEAFKLEKRTNSCLWKLLDAFEMYTELMAKVEDTKSFLHMLDVDSEKLCGKTKELIEFIKQEHGAALAKEIQVQTTSPPFSSEDKDKPDLWSDIQNICFSKKQVDKTPLLTFVIKFPNLQIIRPLLDMKPLDKKFKSLGSTKKFRNPNSTVYHFDDKDSANEAFSYVNSVKDLEGLASMKVQIQEAI